MVAVVVLVVAVATDVTAHARAGSEQRQLASATSTLRGLRTDVRGTTFYRALATNHRNALQASVASSLAWSART